MSGHPPSSLPPIIDSANPIFRTDSSILEFHPINDIAELAFDDLVTAYKAKEIKQHHAEHMVVTGERALSGSRINSGTESSSGDDSKVLAVGYFRIGFTAPTVAGVPMWAMGTSSTKRSASPECKAQRHTKVDVLIARHPYGKGLHREHAFLRIHPESGVWLLSISDHCKPLQSRLGGQPLNASLCQHRPMHLNGKLIRHSEELCLSQSEFTLQFANLSFRVIFKVAQGHQEDSYMKRRNAFLAEMGIPKPPSLISGIPFAHDHRNDLATWRNPYRHGASGVVHLGFDPNEGGLRAVKTWICKRATEASAVMNEIDVSLFLSEKKSEGIIRVFGWRNTAGEKVVRDPPMDYYLVMESGLSFKEIKWPLAQSVTPSEWHERKTLFYQILRGLETIHALKWIHRDVTASNIIYIPAIEAFRSASAKLADFGKLCQSSVHTDHHLAAEKFRAPEVDGQRTYDQRIDIWGLALAMAYCWFTHERPKMNKIEHAAILSVLSKATPVTDLAFLLSDMLAFDDTQRPTATQCLQHSCFKSVQSSRTEPTTFTQTGMVIAVVHARNDEPLAVKGVIIKDRYMAKGSEFVAESTNVRSFPVGRAPNLENAGAKLLQPTGHRKSEIDDGATAHLSAGGSARAQHGLQGRRSKHGRGISINFYSAMSPRTPNVSHLLQELQNALMRFEQQPVQFTYSKETAMMKWLDFLREDLKQNEKRIAQEVACTIFNTISPKASILFASTLPVSAISYNGVPRLIAKQNSIAMSSRNHR